MESKDSRKTMRVLCDLLYFLRARYLVLYVVLKSYITVTKYCTVLYCTVLYCTVLYRISICPVLFTPEEQWIRHDVLYY
jgi:hypothetical protein